MNLEDSPKYQGGLQKIMRMNPAQRAVFDAGIIHGQFADENMRKHLMGMRDASTNLSRQRGLGLSREAFAANTDLSNRYRDFYDKDRRMSEIVAAGGLATDVVQGYQGMKNKEALAKRYAGLGRYLYEGV